MSHYLRNLSRHPGLPVTVFFSALAMADSSHSSRGVLFGAVVASVYWLPVLLTTPRGPQP
jgi:hypothetical protein